MHGGVYVYINVLRVLAVGVFRNIYKFVRFVEMLFASSHPVPQIVFDEKELRREISHAIKNVHGVRQVEQRLKTYLTSSVVTH